MYALTGLYLLYYAWVAALGVFHSIAELVASWPLHRYALPVVPFLCLAAAYLVTRIASSPSRDRETGSAGRPALVGRTAAAVFALSAAIR